MFLRLHIVFCRAMTQQKSILIKTKNLIKNYGNSESNGSCWIFLRLNIEKKKLKGNGSLNQCNTTRFTIRIIVISNFRVLSSN